jgi:hypothetical protein
MSNETNLIERRVVRINFAPNDSLFIAAEKNAKFLGGQARAISPTTLAVNKMIASEDIVRLNLPEILSMSYKDTQWIPSVKNYFNNIYVLINSGGRELNASFRYHNEEDKIKFENEYKDLVVEYNTKSKADIKGDRNYYNEYIDKLFALETKKNKIDQDSNTGKYGKAVEPVDYILWLYCLYCSLVANRFADVKMSRRIRFYLQDEGEAKRREDATFELKKQAMAVLTNILGDETKVNDFLYVYASTRDGLSDNLKKMDSVEKERLLDKLCNDDYTTFLAFAKDPNLIKKAKIERMISYGILRRLPGSASIVDAEDPNEYIGNNVTEALSYLANPAKQVRVNSYYARFKNLDSTINIEEEDAD